MRIIAFLVVMAMFHGCGDPQYSQEEAGQKAVKVHGPAERGGQE